MKRVLIIYTGGTIGMTRTENGYAPRAATSAPRSMPFQTSRTGDAGVGILRALAAAGFIQHDRARMELHRRADRAEI